MCYAKPGPRCSAHARKALAQAKDHYNEAIASGDEKKMAQSKTLLETTIKDYNTTPEGIKCLSSPRARIRRLTYTKSAAKNDSKLQANNT